MRSIDLISLLPLDYETVMNSIAKTNRVVVCQEANLRGGLAGDIVSEIIMPVLTWLLPIVGAAAIVVSYLASVRIYRNQEI